MIVIPNVNQVAIFIWLAVSAGLIFTIGEETGWGGRMYLEPLTVPRLPERKLESPLPLKLSLPKLEQKYNATVERPLFVPTRRAALPLPPPPPLPLPAAPTMQKGQFQLLGTVIIEEKKLAIIRQLAGGRSYYVAKGELINGLLLEKVESNRVVFSQFGDTEEVILNVLPSRFSAQPAKQIIPSAPSSVAQVAAVPVGQPSAQLGAEQPQTPEEVEKMNPFLRALRQRIGGNKSLQQ